MNDWADWVLAYFGLGLVMIILGAIVLLITSWFRG